jgi:hypothetical protein
VVGEEGGRGEELAHCSEEEISLGLVLGLGPQMFDPGQPPCRPPLHSHFPFGMGAWCSLPPPGHISVLPSGWLEREVYKRKRNEKDPI